MFNEGCTSLLQVMNNLEIIIGRQCKSYADKVDEQRVIRENRRSSLATKEARQARQEELLKENEFYEDTEGLLYGAGIAD